MLTLTGAASVADYRTALRSVTYVNSNLDPTEGVRTVTFQVDDGFAYNHASNIKSRGIWVTDHVAPVLSYIENEPLPYHVGQAPAQLTCYLIVELSNIETVVWRDRGHYVRLCEFGRRTELRRFGPGHQRRLRFVNRHPDADRSGECALIMK